MTETFYNFAAAGRAPQVRIAQTLRPGWPLLLIVLCDFAMAAVVLDQTLFAR
ncbi:MAG: hypothetical protein POELPBGB_04205 [Bacteroidia bacterium]|jgi:hypothetical protein|nr:hypothetical protein [Rubrivivax sp.]MCG3168399.1 hypothetical protein [Bacteroidia bacterium]HNQ57622.1 hypothetical protein [Candidatus Desulfobacillus denitrificans]HNT61727.1 hypothetical protein [Candidatus Desulfobacillus denitrificans]